MSKDNGGPAFPCQYQGDTRSDASGISMRDYIAIHATDGDIDDAMAPYLDTGLYSETRGLSGITRQQARYMHADAMLAERAK